MHTKTASFETASLDSDERVFEGWASTPKQDLSGDIVEPLGARLTCPLPLLIGHDSSQPVGMVTDADLRPEGIWVRGQIIRATSAKLRERVDTAWESIKAKILNGLSIGFSPIRPPEPLRDGGLHYTDYLVHELSLCTIPMNSAAKIVSAKSMGTRPRFTPVRYPAPARPRPKIRVDLAPTPVVYARRPPTSPKKHGVVYARRVPPNEHAVVYAKPVFERRPWE